MCKKKTLGSRVTKKKADLCVGLVSLAREVADGAREGDEERGMYMYIYTLRCIFTCV